MSHLRDSRPYLLLLLSQPRLHGPTRVQLLYHRTTTERLPDYRLHSAGRSLKQHFSFSQGAISLSVI